MAVSLTVLEVALGNECGQVEIVLGDDFIAGGVVGNAMFGSRELYCTMFRRTMVQRETLDGIWHPNGQIDIIKLDIEGHETKFLQGGPKQSQHRPVLLIELNRVHQVIRGIDFVTANFILAELRASGIAQIGNLAECSDTDFLAIPEERRHELR